MILVAAVVIPWVSATPPWQRKAMISSAKMITIRNTQYAGVLSFTAECYNSTFIQEEEDYMVG